MVQLYKYWYFTSVLTERFCNDLITYGNSQRTKKALIGGEIERTVSKKEARKIRDVNVAFINDLWIYREIQPYVYTANKHADWNYQWDWTESCQFTKYKLNQHYAWHKDSWEKPYEENTFPHFKGKIRKLSMICSLSDPADYEGGTLEIQPRDDRDPNKIIVCNHLKPRGSIIVFPSYLYHRVKPVTKGMRYTLVTWSIGYPFK